MMRPAWNGPRSLMRTTTLLPLRDVGDAHVARDRQRRVRGGHLVHVVGLAARGLLAVVASCRTSSPCRAGVNGCTEVERHVLLAEHLVRTIGVLVQRLAARHGVGDRGRDWPAGSRPGRRPCSSRPAASAGGAARRAAGNDQRQEPGCLHPSYTTLPATIGVAHAARRARSRGTACSCPGSSAFRARRAPPPAGRRSRGRAGAPAASRPEATPRMRAGSEVMRASVAGERQLAAPRPTSA